MLKYISQFPLTADLANLLLNLLLPHLNLLIPVILDRIMNIELLNNYVRLTRVLLRIAEFVIRESVF